MPTVCWNKKVRTPSTDQTHIVLTDSDQRANWISVSFGNFWWVIPSWAENILFTDRDYSFFRQHCRYCEFRFSISDFPLSERVFSDCVHRKLFTAYQMCLDKKYSITSRLYASRERWRCFLSMILALGHRWSHRLSLDWQRGIQGREREGYREIWWTKATEKRERTAWRCLLMQWSRNGSRSCQSRYRWPESCRLSLPRWKLILGTTESGDESKGKINDYKRQK